MITLFTTWKELGPRETYALRSWWQLRLPERPQILRYMDCDDYPTAEEWEDPTRADAGVAGFCVPATNGRPHVDAMFAHADDWAKYDIRAYVNSDIVLLPTVGEAIQAVAEQLDEFMITSQRWDVKIDVDFDMHSPSWPQHIVEYTAEHGQLHATSGMDIFCWRGEPWGPNCANIPPYIVGCYAWDTDLMCMALESGTPVVDITIGVPFGLIHQNHKLNNRRDTPEAAYNMRRFARGGDYHVRLRGTQHATHVLGADMKVRKK